MKKIVLGSAQFGMAYGIRNMRGKVPKNEVFRILDKAFDAGIDTIDTAHAYGESEEVIGEFLKSSKKNFNLVSKAPECGANGIKEAFDSSLKRLNISAMEGYLVHNFTHYENDKRIWARLREIRHAGKVKKIGFSLYYPHELETIFMDIPDVDIVQLPLNIFDQRFCRYLPQIKKRNIEIHTRSIFLQGLVFERPQKLNACFDPIKGNLEDLNKISNDTGVPIPALCLNFILQNRFVDKVVVGIDDEGQFADILNALNYDRRVAEAMPELISLCCDDENVILPLNWKVARV